jgi:hypothetical protein
MVDCIAASCAMRRLFDREGTLVKRLGVCLSLLVISAASGAAGSAPAADATPASAPRWEAFASCAAAYRANWQNRLSDPNRPPSMAAMINDEFEEYRQVAIAHYEKDQRASKDEASVKVDAHVNGKLDQFIAMDKAGKLEAFIESCPQPEDPN